MIVEAFTETGQNCDMNAFSDVKAFLINMATSHFNACITCGSQVDSPSQCSRCDNLVCSKCFVSDPSGSYFFCHSCHGLAPYCSCCNKLCIEAFSCVICNKFFCSEENLSCIKGSMSLKVCFGCIKKKEEANTTVSVWNQKRCKQRNPIHFREPLMPASPSYTPCSPSYGPPSPAYEESSSEDEEA